MEDEKSETEEEEEDMTYQRKQMPQAQAPITSTQSIVEEQIRNKFAKYEKEDSLFLNSYMD
jgi:hypothetical protein